MPRRGHPGRQIQLFRRACRYLKCRNRRRLFYLLTRSPALLHFIDSSQSLMLLAGWWRRYDVVEWMLANGADPDFVEDGENTLLIHAAAENDVRLAQLLIDRGADIEKANREGETPLGFACAYYAVDTVRLLCERGAVVNRTEGSGHSYLYGVQCARQHEIEAILTFYGAT